MQSFFSLCFLPWHREPAPSTARPLVAPLEMAKHPQFKIIKKKMHKRPKKVLPGALASLLAFIYFPASLILCSFLSSARFPFPVCFSLTPSFLPARLGAAFLASTPQSNASDRNRGGHSTHPVDQRDMSGPGWLFPDQEGWVPYDESVHGPLDEEMKELTEGLDPIWVRIVDPTTGEPKLEDA